MQAIEIFNTVGFAAVITSSTTLVITLLKIKNKQKAADNKIMFALRAIYSNEIRKKGRKYVDRGFITADEYADIEQMNNIYHEELDGNGYTKKIMSKVEQLPIKEIQETKGA